jgi:hypothetical protein
MTNIIRKIKQKYTVLKPFHWTNAGGSKTVSSAGRVYIQTIDIPMNCVAVDVRFQTGATSNGNIRAGLFGPLTTNFDPTGASLVAESASTAAPAAFQPAVISLGSVKVTAGQYALAVAFSDLTCIYISNSSAAVVSNASSSRFDQAFGAMPSTVPALTTDTSNQPAMVLTISTP